MISCRNIIIWVINRGLENNKQLGDIMIHIDKWLEHGIRKVNPKQAHCIPELFFLTSLALHGRHLDIDGRSDANFNSTFIPT